MTFRDTGTGSGYGRVVVSAVAQVLGAALVCLAVWMLAGPWWGVLLAGVALLVGGVLAEAADRLRAEPDRPVPGGGGG